MPRKHENTKSKRSPVSCVRVFVTAVSLCVALCAVASGSALAQAPPGPQGPQCTATRLVGTWERVSLLRNALSVQPPDAPLFVKFGADGYWSMMEMPDDRPKVGKPLEQQTPKELWSRFAKVEGAQGTWTIAADGSVVTRLHLANIAAGGENSKQDRSCIFESDILALIGTGANRSPQARFKRLPAHPMKSDALVGTWERTSIRVDGKDLQLPSEVVILGEDGWFSLTQLPTGRKSVGKPLEQYTADDYAKTFGGVSAARGTYTVDGSTLSLKHIADVDPNRVGSDAVAEFSVQGSTMTLRGTAPSGAKIEARYQRLKPLETTAR